MGLEVIQERSSEEDPWDGAATFQRETTKVGILFFFFFEMIHAEGEKE